MILLEIGGYFSPILKKLQKKLNGNLIGAIEDTETGHRLYEKLGVERACPVISVARSSLKDTEDFLVGTSCLFSTEKLLRQNGLPLEGKRSLVLGFGKVGRGVAHALMRNYCPVSVYDIDPIRRINAISEGFQAQDKESAFKYAEIIYGTTGNFSISSSDFKLLRNGTLLVSCSSKDIEFDLEALQQNYKKQNICDGLDVYKKEDQYFYLAANGRPINFRDGAVIGPILALVQAEIIFAIKQLLEKNLQNEIYETDMACKKVLAEKWLQHFCDGRTGRYRLDSLPEVSTNLQIIRELIEN